MTQEYMPLTVYSLNKTGHRYGRLLALGAVERNRRKHLVWHCLCDCGRETFVESQHLRDGGTQSCGCLRRENRGPAQHQRGKIRHGMTNHPLYKTWTGMRNRCSNPKNNCYARYGGRGISVHPPWDNSFISFLDYVSALPGYGVEGMTIDRIDNDGDYVPGNVRWATKKVQGRNQRTNVFYTYDGRTMILQDWADEVGINPMTLWNRLEYGWDFLEALTAPIDERRRRKSVRGEC